MSEGIHYYDPACGLGVETHLFSRERQGIDNIYIIYGQGSYTYFHTLFWNEV